MDKEWLEKQLKIKSLTMIANELDVPYSRVQQTVKKFGIVIPKRKNFYTEETRKAKSEAVKAALAKRYPDGRTGENHPRWKGGMPKCQDCDKLLTRKEAKRCAGCERSDNRKGEKNQNWRDGASTENKKARSRKEYKVWKKAVLEIDDYTCQMCGTKEGQLHVDHIKPFAYYPELRFSLDNGRALCVKCHRSTPTWGAGPKIRRPDPLA